MSSSERQLSKTVEMKSETTLEDDFIQPWISLVRTNNGK